MKTLTIINTILSSFLIPILFSSIFFPNESSHHQQAEHVVCDQNTHNVPNAIVEDRASKRAVLDDTFKKAVEDNAPDRVVLDDTFQKAIEAMRSEGYKVMASFLESQLLGSDMEEYSNSMVTVFAPSDEAVARAKVGFGELPQILLRHITSTALFHFLDGFHLWRTFLPGFVVIKSWDMLNCEVPFTGPLLYSDFGRKLYVYGLPEILSPLTAEEVSKRRGGLLRPCEL